MLPLSRKHQSKYTFAVAANVCGLLLTSSVIVASPSFAENADDKAVKPLDKAVKPLDKADTPLEKSDSADGKDIPELSACIRIKAPKQAVWDAIHEERESAPGLAYSKVLEHENNHYLIEQKFTLIPFVSSTTRTLDINETPNDRIDYKVVATGHEKPLKGSWTLKSEDTEDKLTLLALSAQSQRIEKNLVAKELATMWLKRRLDHVKEFAERNARLSLEGQVLPKKGK
jgi:carbon monoxide dehydrogenase subunit G